MDSFSQSGGITGKLTVVVLFCYFGFFVFWFFLMKWFFNYSESYLAAEEKCCWQWCQPPIIRRNQIHSAGAASDAVGDDGL